MYTEFYW